MFLNQNTHFWGVCFIKFWWFCWYFRILGFLGVFFEFGFWVLKILKKCFFESEYPLLGGSVLWTICLSFLKFCDFGFLGGLFEFGFWVLKILKMFLESEYPLLGGSVLFNIFDFVEIFWFWNFRGSFLSLVFEFWKFWKCFWNQNTHFWGGLFYDVCWFCWNFVILDFIFRGSFLSLVFEFWKFQI